MNEPLYHGWHRPARLPRQRRKRWVRVTESPVTREEAANAASDYAALQGGGDTCARPAHKDPNDDEV